MVERDSFEEDWDGSNLKKSRESFENVWDWYFKFYILVSIR
jgi:hypothetical protein